MVDKPYCRKCGADYNSLCWDATARWAPEAKEDGDGMHLADVMDQGYCDECEEGVKIEWREEEDNEKGIY